MMNLHNVEIVKTSTGEIVLLDGKPINGVVDFTLTRKAKSIATIQMELIVGEVQVIDTNKTDAQRFEEWADRFNQKFTKLHGDTMRATTITIDGKEI